MESFFTQVFNLLTTSPGNLAYYVVLAFTVVAALQSSINFWRRSGFPQGNRMVTGLGLLLLLQLAQFSVAGLAWQGVINTQVWLAPLDRFVILVGIILITWLWLAPEPRLLVDLFYGLMFLLACAYLVLSLQWWAANVSQFYYNANWPDWSSNWFAMFLLGIGSLGLLIRRPNGWGTGLAMLALLFAGQLGQYLFPVLESDFAAPVRMAQLAAFPWLLTLPQRFPIPAATMVSLKPAQTPTLVERRRYTTDPKTVQEFIGLLNAPTDQLCANIARLLSKMMLADYCLVVASSESDSGLTVACAYNLIEEKTLPGFSLDARLAPMVSSALRRNKPLRLPSSSTSTDLQALGQGLHLDRVGHLLAAPISVTGHQPLMGVILLSPFSNRGWTAEDQDVLVNYTHFLARVSQQTDSAIPTDASLEQLRAELKAVQQTRQELLAQLEAAQSQAAQERSRAESLAAMVGLQGTAVINRDSAAEETQIAGGAANGFSQTRLSGESLLPESMVSQNAFEELQADLRLALEQVAELRLELAQIEERKALAPYTLANPPDQKQPETSASPQIEEIAAIVTDLHQPLSSILGYADVLLGESVGGLGALQRKFLERIRASAERMGGMADDLNQLTALQEAQPHLTPQVVDVTAIIQTAVANVQEQLARRSQSLRTDIAENLPSINADQQAVQQVLVSLLRNAACSSPDAAEVQLRVRHETRNQEPGFILIQVLDSSEGISPQDLPRVFSRLPMLGVAQADQPDGLQPGEGIDLALVKALVEAHGGRIWVDSTPGKGSTFSALLPVEFTLESE